MSKPTAPVGSSLIVLSSALYASYGIWTKQLGDDFGGFTASAIRSAIALVILIPAALYYKQFAAWKIKANLGHLLGLVAAACVVWGPLYYSILHAGVGTALAVNYASIMVGMFFLGRVMAGERLTGDKVFSAGLGIVGIALIFVPDGHHPSALSLAAALLSGLGSAANSVIAKQIPYSATQSTVALCVTSLIGNTAMAFVFDHAVRHGAVANDWIYLVVFGVTSVGASWCFITGLKLVENGVAAILGLLEIVFALVFGAIFFDERPGALVLLGALAIIFAAGLPYFRESRTPSLQSGK